MALEAYDTIFQQFSSVSPEEWKTKIIKDSKVDSFENLISYSNEGIEILPFYTKEDNEKYQLSIPKKQKEDWEIVEKIIVHSIEEANQQALKALSLGANLLHFDLLNTAFNDNEFKLLLDKIILDAVTIRFENYVESNKDSLERISINSCPAYVNVPELSTISDELAFALKNGMLQKTDTICFQFKTGSNYFFEIAKLRAFRWLWKQLSELINKSSTIMLQSETSIQHFSTSDPYSNILKNTTAAMSAVLGGCDSLYINSHDSLNEKSDFGKRIALNIHHILQEEASFNFMDDISRGTYYIEYLTYQFSKISWEKFSAKV